MMIKTLFSRVSSMTISPNLVDYSNPHTKVDTGLFECDNEQHDGMVHIFKMNINCVLEFVKWPSCMMHALLFVCVNEIMYKKYI